MKLRALVLPCLLSAGLWVPAAHAQRQGTLEFGLYARKNWFGESYALANRVGGGARLGFYLLRHLELEANGAYTPTRLRPETTNEDVRVWRFNGAIHYDIPLSDHAAFILGGGYTYNKYQLRAAGTNNDMGHETGPSGLVGFRFGLGSTVSIRIDGTFDYFSSPDSLLTFPNVEKDYHYGVQAGLAFLFGNRGESYKGNADADGDGVNDAADQCPGTPKGTQVNSSGCPMVAAVNADSIRMAAQADSMRMKMHADSVAAAARADSLRMAQEAQAKAAQAAKDSAEAAAKANADRIAALEDSLRSARGAALRASLRDSLAAARMRDSLRVLMATPNAKLILAGVNFATNSATLTQSSRFILDEVAQSLVANPDVRIEVGGHTDNTGSRALNERLSQARAESVKQYLVDHGVSADRLEAKGYAWDRPVATNKTIAGRAMNRRTELDRLN
jgi:OOP family OmpA-OmpF porin